MSKQTGMMCLVALLVGVVTSAVNAESHLMRFADASAESIVFTYEGDLWTVPLEGGDAHRITNGRGDEVDAKFSPDGKRLAFTATYDGGVDVYVMDAKGGAPTRLTFHPAADRVLDWYPDGKSILFRSRRAYPTRGEEIYRISVDGGMPERLPVDRAGLTSLSPDATQIAYNRISRETRTWKRHQGGTAQDIWVGSLAKGDYKRITDWKGSDNYPMWDGDAIYFNSDRKFGTMNLYKYDLKTGEVTALTSNKDYDVKYPSLGVGAIVYQYGESLHLVDLATGKAHKVPVNVPTDSIDTRPTYVSATADAGAFGLSPTGKRVLCESRGEIINVPAKDGDAINLTETSGTREKNAAWSPNGRWVAFISDKTGEEEIYLVDQKGEQPWKQLTKGGHGWRMQLVWSPDSKWLLFADKYMKLSMVDAETGEITVIAQGEYDDGWERWGIQSYSWSPDSKWITYDKLEESLNQSVFLYSLADSKTYRVTSEMTQDWSPSFDPDGKYLYFLSERTFDPIMGFVDQNHIFLELCKPYIVVLAEDGENPFALEDSEEPVKDDAEAEVEDADGDKDKDADKDADEDKDAKKADSDEIKIDPIGLERRTLVAKGVPAGNYFRLEAIKGGFLYLKKEGHEFLKYQSVTDHTGGRLDLYSYKIEKDPKDRKPEKILSGISNYHLSADGKKLVYRVGGTVGVVDAGKKAKVGDGEIHLDSVKMKIDLQAEFLQIFNEAWRVQRDWFYDANMHGVDWVAMGEKYRRFIPNCGDRSDVNYLIGEMIGELNSGHTYISGGDIPNDGKYIGTGLLGVDFEQPPTADYYRISHIIPGTPWDDSDYSPLAELGCPIKEGDYLIAIDGHEVRTDDNIYRHLENKRGKIVKLTYNSKPTMDGAKDYRVRTIGSEYGLLYNEWVERNRAAVDKASNGEIGYVHIPDMGEPGLIEFAKVWYACYAKKGMVIDVRYNGGGFTGDMIIDRIERQMWAATKPREGKIVRDPERVFYGHIALIMNEDTGSCGEYFSEAMKRKGLATAIGMRTWGGAVGIEPHQELVDGGVTTPPQFAPYGLDGQWLIEGHGVDPDIEVQNMPGDVIKGIDAQLDTAIAFLIEKIATEPKEIPAPPAYVDRSKPEN